MWPVELSSLTVRDLTVPTKEPFVIATGEVRATRSVLVEITLRDGRKTAHGLGEGACFPPVTVEDQPDAYRAIRAADQALLGSRLGSLERMTELLDATLGGSPVARAAVEIALLDALARLEGQPLYRWLGGGDAAPLETDITIPILAPERMAQLALEWWAKGFRALKLKVGRQLDDDLRALEAIVRVVPHARFRPDANGGLTVKEALEFATAAKRLGAELECFEQPCASLEELAEVSLELSDVPVIADESVQSVEDLERAADTNACDGVNLKIVKCGSLLRARQLGLAARGHAMSLMVGGMVETRLGMTAATHLAASLGGADFADLDTAWLLTDDPFEGGYEAGGPRYVLPNAPGLGITLRPPQS